MFENRRIGAVLLMAGSGSRFGSALPKQLHRLVGKPVFLHALEAFLAAEIFDEIVLSCHPDWMPQIAEMLPSLAHPKIQMIPGGATRQESSRRGLLAFETAPDIAAIHDAVRPFVTPEILLENVRAAIRTGAADTCIPSADTLVHAPGRFLTSIPPRSEYLRGQTPQTFSYPLILRAHHSSLKENASDDCQLVLDLNHPVEVVCGSEDNIKITSELDLFLAEQIFRLRLNSIPRDASRLSLRGKKYAIVGASGGIGRAIADKLTSLGAEPIPLSRTSAYPIDLACPQSIERALLKLRTDLGLLDGLINCAGILNARPLDSLSNESIEQMIRVNLHGLILCCKKAPLKSGAHVLNIASSSFSRGRKNACVYSATKAAVVNFTQGWAQERPDLHIHAVVPQRTNTPMRTQNYPEDPPRDLIQPEEIAETIADLLSQTKGTGLIVEIKRLDKVLKK